MHYVQGQHKIQQNQILLDYKTVMDSHLRFGKIHDSVHIRTSGSGKGYIIRGIQFLDPILEFVHFLSQKLPFFSLLFYSKNFLSELGVEHGSIVDAMTNAFATVLRKHLIHCKQSSTLFQRKKVDFFQNQSFPEIYATLSTTHLEYL